MIRNSESNNTLFNFLMISQCQPLSPNLKVDGKNHYITIHLLLHAGTKVPGKLNKIIWSIIYFNLV